MIKKIVYNILLIPIILFLFVWALFCYKKKKDKIIFGTTPILNNKYWSNALKKIGFNSQTLMDSFYLNLHQEKDFDLYYDNLVPNFIRIKLLRKLSGPILALMYILSNAKYVVIPFHGIVLKNYIFWKIEPWLLKLANVKAILFPYGSDAYMYSRIKDPCLQNGLLLSYPEAAKLEKEIEEKVFYWSKHSSIVPSHFMTVDGMPRWNVCLPQFITINTDLWTTKETYSNADGKDNVVKILHTPNHKGFKGTEFLVQAIEELKAEGIKVELILLENIQNEEVKKIMQDVDILAEQFIGTGYALSGIEGMASGLPVLANLENEAYTRIFRRYSFLNECPILSTTPEILKENLKILIQNPELRQELGQAGRAYVEKYHSDKMAQYLFGSIFKYLEGEDVDLMNLFHPLKSEYVKKNKIIHPLNENKLI